MCAEGSLVSCQDDHILPQGSNKRAVMTMPQQMSVRAYKNSTYVPLFLPTVINMFISPVRLCFHFTMGVSGDGIAYCASLKWPFQTMFRVSISAICVTVECNKCDCNKCEIGLMFCTQNCHSA